MRWTIVLVAVLIALPGTAAAAVVPDGGVRVSTADTARELQVAKDARIGWVSLATSWASLQPVEGGALGSAGPGGAAWAPLEESLRRAHALGLRTLVQFTGAPGWASGGPYRLSAPPTEANVPRYAGFLEEFAQRLGPFVDAYSPWNEPNMTRYWSPTDPARYVRLQRAAYGAIKRGDPGATVMSGPVYSRAGSFDFLSRAFDAGMAGTYDVLGWMLFPQRAPEEGVQPGQSWPQPVLPVVIDLRALLQARDPGRPIWIAEFSYPTCQGAASFGVCVSPAVQADYLTRTFAYMRRHLTVERLFWYQLRDPGVGTGVEDNQGLVRHDFSPKPALAAMAALAGDDPADPTPTLPASVARPPDPPSFRAADGRRVAIGKPRLRLRRGVFTLTFGVTVRGGTTRVAIQGYRTRWRRVAGARLARSSRVTVRFPDRGYLGLRIRASLPGSRDWVASRVVRITLRR